MHLFPVLHIILFDNKLCCCSDRECVVSVLSFNSTVDAVV